MPIFSITFTIDKSQTEGGRLEHIALIELLKEARLAFLKKHNMNEDCIVDGIGLVIGELNIRYINVAREGDKLNIALNIQDILDKRCTLLYQVKKQPENQVIALGKTEIIFIDMAREKATKIPEKFLEIVKMESKQNQWVMSRL